MEVRYRSKAVEGGRTGRLTLKLTFFGLACMLIALALSGGNVLIGALGLAVPVFWLASRRVKALECGVSAAGIRETWLDAGGAPVAGRERMHPWPSVESWLLDEDDFSDVGTRRYAEIRFRGGHRIRFRAGDGADPAERFEDFASAFTRFAQPGAGSASTASAAAPPRQRRSFYRRPVGRIVTVVLTLLCAGLIYVAFVAPEYFPDTGWWKISLVFVPGCAYMIWRSFRRQ